MAIKQKKNSKSAVKLPPEWKKPIRGWEGRSAAPEITAEMLEPQNVKEKISIWLDQDVLDYIREVARKQGEKYQPLINRTLRQIFVPGTGVLPRTSEELTAQLQAIWIAIEELKRRTED